MKSLGLTQKLKDFDRDFAVLAVWRKPDVIPRGLRALKGRALFVVLHRLVIDVQDQLGFFAYFGLKMLTPVLVGSESSRRRELSHQFG